MTIIKIAPHENGAHDNQTINGATPETFPIPDGYAVIPPELGTPETLENYPFGKIVVDNTGDWPEVLEWWANPIPEPEPAPEESGYSEMQQLGQQVTDLELQLMEHISQS